MSEDVMAEQGMDVEADRARDVVRAFAASGKTLRDYCNETGQAYWALRRWRLKYAEEVGAPIKRRAGSTRANAAARTKALGGRAQFGAGVAVVPVQILATPQLSSVSIEVRLRGERSLVVAPGIDSATLSRLIGVIERAV